MREGMRSLGMAALKKFSAVIAIHLLLIHLDIVHCYDYPGAPDTTLVSEICNG